MMIDSSVTGYGDHPFVRLSMEEAVEVFLSTLTWYALHEI